MITENYYTEKHRGTQNMEWYKEINYKKYLNGDLKLMEEIVGVDNLMKLYDSFAKTAVYFSETPLMNMKEEYIKKNFGLIPEKQLARMLKVSERYVYKIGAKKVIIEQENLFNE